MYLYESTLTTVRDYIIGSLNFPTRQVVSLSSHFLFIFFKESGRLLLENSQNGLFCPLGLPILDFTTGMFIG